MTIARRHWLPGLGLSVIVLIGLLIAASQQIAVRTFALDVPNQVPVAVINPSQRVCEGPVISPSAASSVGIWGASTGGTARLTVDVQDAGTGTALASGRRAIPGVENEYAVGLGRPLPAGRPLRICLTDTAGAFSLAGAQAIHPGMVTTGKVAAGQEFSLVLLTAPRSLLGALGTAFSRASLWRPSWVGSWTFWLLAVAIVASLGVAALAVASAADADDASA